MIHWLLDYRWYSPATHWAPWFNYDLKRCFPVTRPIPVTCCMSQSGIWLKTIHFHFKDKGGGSELQMKGLKRTSNTSLLEETNHISYATKNTTPLGFDFLTNYSAQWCCHFRSIRYGTLIALQTACLSIFRVRFPRQYERLGHANNCAQKLGHVRSIPVSWLHSSLVDYSLLLFRVRLQNVSKHKQMYERFGGR